MAGLLPPKFAPRSQFSSLARGHPGTKWLTNNIRPRCLDVRI